MIRRGMSFVEILVALTILGVVVVPIFLTFHTGTQEAKRIAEEQAAVNAGSSFIEQLAHIPYSKIPLLPPNSPDSSLRPLFSPPMIEQDSDPRFDRQISIEDVSGPEVPGRTRCHMKLITVRLVWKPEYLREQSSRTLTFTTLITDQEEE
jgi:prepilin-type N-terminal cleavage/methylation domain-containing protein